MRFDRLHQMTPVCGKIGRAAKGPCRFAHQFKAGRTGLLPISAQGTFQAITNDLGLADPSRPSFLGQRAEQ